MIKAISSFSTNRSVGGSHYRRIICAVLGHARSKFEARELDGVWYSVCERCACPMRRDSQGSWHEITRIEYSDELKRMQAAWRPRAVGTPQAPDDGSTTSHPKAGSDQPTAQKGYDARYFARKHGIALEQAREIIAAGGDRETLNAAADKLKSEGLPKA